MTQVEIMQLPVGSKVHATGLYTDDLDFLYAEGYFAEEVAGHRQILRRDFPSGALRVEHKPAWPIGLERRISSM